MRTILIVDDEPGVRSSLAAFLNIAGYASLVAGNGRDALSIASAYRYDFALLDINMPEMDGIDLCAALHESAKSMGTLPPLIWIMTGAPTASARDRAFAAGARGFVLKPFNFRSLLKQMEQALQPGSPAQPTPPSPREPAVTA